MTTRRAFSDNFNCKLSKDRYFKIPQPYLKPLISARSSFRVLASMVHPMASVCLIDGDDTENYNWERRKFSKIGEFIDQSLTEYDPKNDTSLIGKFQLSTVKPFVKLPKAIIWGCGNYFTITSESIAQQEIEDCETYIEIQLKRNPSFDIEFLLN